MRSSKMELAEDRDGESDAKGKEDRTGGKGKGAVEAAEVERGEERKSEG